MMIKNKLALLATVAIRAFNNGGWKLDADGKIELKDGNPIYVDASGREMTVQGDTISRLNGEAKSHREAKEAAEAKLEKFKDIKDPAAAAAAIEKLAQIDQGQLIAAGKVEEVKRQITEQLSGQIAEKDKALEAANSKIHSMQINSVFANSEFVRDRVAVPRDMFEATFRDRFKVDGDKVVATDRNGNPIYSKQNVGELANPEEAIALLVDMHPQKDVILKANSGSGSGNNGNGGSGGRGRVMKRSEFEALPPMKQAEYGAAMGKGELTIVD